MFGLVCSLIVMESDLVKISKDPLNHCDTVDFVKDVSAGAVSVFLGKG